MNLAGLAAGSSLILIGVFAFLDYSSFSIENWRTLFFALTMVLRQGLRGVGDTRWTLLITTCSSYGIRLPACWLLGIHFELGLAGIWMGLMGEIVLRGMFFLARFLHGGWTGIKV